MFSSPYSLEERTTKFSITIIDLCKSINVTTINRPIVDQLIRSATSIGANYAEANNASSRNDFRNKIFIAKKEAAETEYWLTILSKTEENKVEIESVKQECHFILMTLQKIISTMRDSERLTVNSKRDS